MTRAISAASIWGLAFILIGLPSGVNAQSVDHVKSPGLRPAAPVVPATDDTLQRRSRAQVAEPAAAVDEPSGATADDTGPSLEEGGRLNLMCFGGGAANKLDVATAYGWSRWGHSTATIIGSHDRGFEDQVSLFIQGAEGRVRMPRSMLPVIRGGEDGWFKLHDLKIKENEITGSIGINALNNPRLRLDRYTGAISISGKAGDFAGRCRKFNPETEHRAF